MRFAAKDGSMHRSQKAAYDASQKPQKADVMPAGDSQGQPPIQDNPEAMQLVDQLKQMGYTPDDVARAMDDTDNDGVPASASPAASAKLNIPGVQ